MDKQYSHDREPVPHTIHHWKEHPMTKPVIATSIPLHPATSEHAGPECTGGSE